MSGSMYADVGRECRMVDVIRAIAMQYLSSVNPADKLMYYPGSDTKIIDVLLKLFARSGARHFVEVFGGSGVATYHVTIHGMFKTVVYNDIDDLLIDTFTAIRDMPQDVAWRLLTTPCSRRYWQRVARAIRTGEIRYWTRVDRAVATIFYHHMTIAGTANKTTGFFGTRTRHSTIDSRCGELAEVAATVLEWARVWRSVVIESMDFRKLIRTYDKENTLFYCDPPFVAEKYRRYYRHNFDHRDMQELLELLRTIRGKWILKLTHRNLKYDYIRNFARNYAMHVLNVSVGRNKEEGRIVLIHNLPSLDAWIQT